MKILITDNPGENGYMESLINAYSRAGLTVTTGAKEFFFSDNIPDILHIQWPESLYHWYAPKGMSGDRVYQLMAERLAWYKSHGVTILHTIHNLAPHDCIASLHRDAYRLIIDQSDILVHHCHDSIGLLSDNYPSVADRTNIVCPHGDYLIHHRTVSSEQARQRYGIPKDRQVILNFGRQRPYKNERFITSVFNRIRVQNKFLTIAGTYHYPEDDRWLRIRNRFRKHYPYRDRKYIYRLFPDTEIADIMSSADIIFLGQRNALNSGLTSLAATFGKPVVCPDVGCFGQSLDGWRHETYRAGDLEDATRALQHMCSTLPDSSKLDNSTWLKKHSWDNHVAKILAELPGQTNTNTLRP